jgi:hypothetical protein
LQRAAQIELHVDIAQLLSTPLLLSMHRNNLVNLLRPYTTA